MKFFFTILIILFSVNGYAEEDYFIDSEGAEHKLCNIKELNKCLDGLGGNTCFVDFCVEGINKHECNLNEFKSCIDTGAGFSCDENCGDGGSEYRHVYPYRFPINGDPPQFLSGVRSFGSYRSSGRRRHAAVDLEEKVGKKVLAVANGTVVDYYPFYRGTMALVVDHGDFIIRYGEISKKMHSVKIGAKVQKGQHIASVGNLIGMSRSMLHLEMYSGERTGPLTRYSGIYQRRKDLVDPTDKVEKWRLFR